MKLIVDWSAMNQKRVKLQKLKHQVMESGLERESLGVILHH